MKLWEKYNIQTIEQTKMAWTDLENELELPEPMSLNKPDEIKHFPV